MAFHLTNAADEDVTNLFLAGASLFGVPQAKAYHAALNRVFSLIADNPKIAREREELSPPLRIHPFGSHIIIYKIEDDGDVLIIRVRHAHEDWQDDPLGL